MPTRPGFLTGMITFIIILAFYF